MMETGITDKERIDFSGMLDEDIRKKLDDDKIPLTPEEARKVQDEFLKRPPTKTELWAYGTEGSEHCCYKSSWNYLPLLPSEAPNVMLGPKEDAGIVELAKYETGEGKRVRYGIVAGHESHNHPSYIDGYTGAGTGVGGIVRDIMNMGVKRVIALMDYLGFGNPRGEKGNKTKLIYDGVVAGIADYGNSIGVPNIGGRIHFDDGFDHNCLVNVVSLGLIEESDIIHSRVPESARGKKYDIILVGKPTDNTGFGGVSFASDALDEGRREEKKGAVQVPNPFLERMLMDSSYDVFGEVIEKGLVNEVGFKDLGGGGILCSTSELAASGRFGAYIDLDRVPVSMKNLHSSEILCSETQERFCWIVPESFTERVLHIYNVKWGFPGVSEGARAEVIGHVTGDRNYVVKHRGEVVCNVPIDSVTEGFRYEREYEPMDKSHLREPEFCMPDLGEALIKVMGSENGASRRPVYERYDGNVQGNTIIERGRATAGVIAALMDEDLPEEALELKKIGVAPVIEGNPRYGKISPLWQAINACAVAQRGVASVGADVIALTDCCNYGNPEVPEQFWEFVQGINGLRISAREMGLREFRGKPVPVISGNVSFYNESIVDGGGKTSIPPCMTVAAIGRTPDFTRTVTKEFKSPRDYIFMLGKRRDELGGSLYGNVMLEHLKPGERIGANVPKPDLKMERKYRDFVVDAIRKGYVSACRDISVGGLGRALVDMCLGENGEGNIGAGIILGDYLSEGSLRMDKILFSETGGYLMEVEPGNFDDFLKMCGKYGVNPVHIGHTSSRASINAADFHGKDILDMPLSKLRGPYTNGLREAMR